MTTGLLSGRQAVGADPTINVGNLEIIGTMWNHLKLHGTVVQETID